MSPEALKCNVFRRADQTTRFARRKTFCTAKGRLDERRKSFFDWLLRASNLAQKDWKRGVRGGGYTVERREKAKYPVEREGVCKKKATPFGVAFLKFVLKVAENTGGRALRRRHRDTVAMPGNENYSFFAGVSDLAGVPLNAWICGSSFSNPSLTWSIWAIRESTSDSLI